MKRNLKLIVAMLLVAVTLLGAALPALAATKYVQAKEAVNIRKGPGTNYAAIGWLQAGAVVERTGASGKWTQISLGNGTYGYVSTAYLRSVTNVSSSLVGVDIVLEGGSGASSGLSTSTGGTSTGGTLYYSTTRLNLRRGPGTSYAIVGCLEKGEQVSVISVSNKWAKVRWNNVECYAFFSYLKPVSGSASTGSGSSAAGNTYYSTTRLNLRKGPGTKYSIVGWLETGEQVTVLSVSGNWAKVRWNNTECYAFFKYLKKGSSAVTYNVTTAAVTAYYGPGTNYAVAGSVTKGARIECLGTVGSWTMISWGGNIAYIPTTYVGTQTTATPQPGVTTAGYYITTQQVEAYRGPGANYGIAAVLRKGVQLWVSGVTGSWAIANLDGQAVYVQSRYLTLQKAESGAIWNSSLNSEDSSIASEVKAARALANDPYSLKDVKSFYTTYAPAGYSLRSVTFSGANAMTVTFKSGSKTAEFVWYRNKSAFNGNLVYWSYFVSGGVSYFFLEDKDAGCIEAYWERGGEAFYAKVPYSFTRSEAESFFNSLHKVTL